MENEDLIQCPICPDKIKLEDLFEHAKFHFNENYELIMKYYALTFNWEYPIRCRYKTCKTGLVGIDMFTRLPMDVCPKCYNSRHRGKKSLLERNQLTPEARSKLKSELMFETVNVYRQRHLYYREYDKHNFKDRVITTPGENYGTKITRSEINKGYRVFKCNLCGHMLNYTELMRHHLEHEMTREDFFVQYEGLKEIPKCWNCGKPVKFSNTKFVNMKSNGFNHYCCEDCRFEAKASYLDLKAEKEDSSLKVSEEDLGTNFLDDLCSGKLDNKKRR